MKLNSSPAQTASRTNAGGRAWCGPGCLLAVALFSAGCHKADDTAAAPPPAPAAATPSTNQDGQAAAPAAVVNNQAHVPMGGPVAPDVDAPPTVKPGGEPDLHALDQAMLGWLVANRRRPSSFQEFAATAGVAIPPPPPGKMYAISSTMHVILIDQKQ
jgi:hypothetical protein